jgi:hypothetical protein
MNFGETVMRKILFVALTIAGISSTILPGQAFASAVNGINLANGIRVANGVDINGTDLGGLSLEGVILPEAQGR